MGAETNGNGVVMRPRAAVILVNHGDYAQRYLAECYASLCAQTYPQEYFAVFIINNEATEAGTQLAAHIAPTARFFDDARNLGWSGGNNRALKVALAEGFEYLVLLNMDTVVDPYWLETLVKAADDCPDLHILQSKILLHGTTRINSLGNRIQFLGYGYCDNYGQENSPVPTALPGDYVSGAAMLVKRQVFEHIGLFRDEYFMYHDDLEFCWRARLAGYNVGVVDASICHHKYTFPKPLDMLFYLDRNRLMTIFTLEKLRTLVLILPCLVFSEAVMSIFFLAKGWGQVRVRLWRHFLAPDTWRLIRARRKEIGHLRARKDKEIVGKFEGRILFSEIDNPVLRYLGNPLLWLYWTAIRMFIVW